MQMAVPDAFSKIDGGGAGRDAKDDRRMELKEWMEGYKGVRNYGFVAFKDLANDDEARAVFAKMDADGAGMVLLIEFCDYIKAAEIEENTPLGGELNEDEGVENTSGAEYKIDFSGAGSQPLNMFTECFLPLCAKTDEAAKLRKAGFRAADRKTF